MTAAKIPVAAVVGPTATGKTELGIQLCQRLGGEIVSCDSMQVYKGLPIGTAQPTAEELAAAPHHLIGFLDVEQPFSVSDYVDAAGQVIREISGRGKLPILVGGTGLYARSLLRGFSFEERGRNDALRQRLFQEAEDQGIDALYQRLEQLDPKAAEEIHPHNVKRVIRALEYIQLCGEPFSAQAERSHSAQSPYQYVMLCLGYENRKTLYRRIDARVDKMLEQGLLPEAQAFLQPLPAGGEHPHRRPGHRLQGAVPLLPRGGLPGGGGGGHQAGEPPVRQAANHLVQAGGASGVPSHRRLPQPPGPLGGGCVPAGKMGRLERRQRL